MGREENQQVFTGYFVQRQLQVEINDLDKLGNVIEGAIDAGVNEVSPPALDSSKAKELNRDALAAARLTRRRMRSGWLRRWGEAGGCEDGGGEGAMPRPPMPMQEVRLQAMAMDSAGKAAANYVPGEISFRKPGGCDV